MTKAQKNNFVEREAVHYFGYLCAQARLIFREKETTDVGVDGEVELVNHDRTATGILAGVQIKGGQTFYNSKKQEIKLSSNKKHWLMMYYLPAL